MKLLMSALVLNGSRSGYRRIIKNLLLHYNKSHEIELFAVFQRSGFESLEIELSSINSNVKVIVLNDFKSKWLRGIVEQLYIPYLSIIHNVHWIFMPATFGLAFPIKPIMTFVHTNTNFSVAGNLRGRSWIQQQAHKLLVLMTSKTSKRLIFTTDQTFQEYCQYTNKCHPKLIVGNGLLTNSERECSDRLPHNLDKNKYFLSVSQFYRLKNFDGLLRSFISLKKSKSISEDICLVIVGTIQERDYYEELVELVGNRNDIYFMHDISDDLLLDLFCNAKGYCFFSYFEGYSLTPAEALLSGINVAISDIPTHREIYEDVPIYADPSSDDSIASAILQLNNNTIPQSESPKFSKVIDKFSFDAFVSRFEKFLAG